MQENRSLNFADSSKLGLQRRGLLPVEGN